MVFCIWIVMGPSDVEILFKSDIICAQTFI